MNQEQKPKMKLWKKITIGVVAFLIVMAVIGNFLDKYDLGISSYKKQDYESAYNYFKQVKPDHKNYADAVKMTEISKIKMDSVELASANLEKLKKEKELAENKSNEVIKTVNDNTNAIKFEILRKWNPDNNSNAVGMDILIDKKDISEAKVIELINQIAEPKYEKINILVFSSKNAWTENQRNSNFTDDYKKNYIGFYVKNNTDEGAYSGLNEIKWMQELGEVEKLYGTKTVLPLNKGQVIATTSAKIPGLKPVDVYGNLENKGFTVTKEFSTDNGCWWYCEKIEDGIKYYIRISSSDVSSVEQISCNASVTTASNVKNSKSFLQYISSIPYENSDPNKISKWLNTNYNNDKASTVISGVKFSIYTKTEFGILFVIEAEK